MTTSIYIRLFKNKQLCINYQVLLNNIINTKIKTIFVVVVVLLLLSSTPTSFCKASADAPASISISSEEAFGDGVVRM